MSKPNARNVGAELLVDLADNLTVMAMDMLGIPEAAARRFGQEAAARVADHWGGQAVYIPMDLAARMSTRNDEIYKSFTGDNVSELVRKFKLSRQAIYRIIHAERQRRAPRQGNLSDFIS